MKTQIDQAAKIVRQGQIPSLPLELEKITQLMASELVNISEVATLVARNPQLNAHFLDVANACLKDREQEIRNVEEAIKFLGLKEVSTLIYSASLMDHFVSNQAEADFMNYVVKLATVAQEISEVVYGVSRAEAYLTALLSEIGVIAFARIDANYLQTTYKKYRSLPLLREKVYLHKYQTGLDFVSALISKKWKVDSVISKAIILQNKFMRDTSKPDGEKITKLVSILNIAKIFQCEMDDHCYITDEMRELRMNATDFLGEIPAETYQNAYQVMKSHQEMSFQFNNKKSTVARVA